MRLELNVAALERLLGGDSDMELHLRQQVGEQFCKKHLKTMLNDEVYKKVNAEWEAQLKTAVAQAIEEIKGTHQNIINDGYTNYRLEWNFKDVIDKAVQKVLDEKIKKVIEYQSHYFFSEIHNAVNKSIMNQVDKIVEERIQQRLQLAKEMK